MDKKLLWIFGGGLALIVILIIVVIALGTQNKKNKTQELNWVTYNEEQENLAEVISAFESQNNVKVNWIKKDIKNYELDSLNLLSTGEIDIWGIPDNWIPKHQDKLAPLTTILSADTDNISYYQSIYPQIVSSESIINNQIYGFPLSADALVLFVNQNLKPENDNLTDEEADLVRKIPETWENLVKVAPLLSQKKGNTMTRSGAALGTENLAAAPDILTALMLQYGTRMTNDEKTQATFHTAANTLGGQSYPGPAALDLYTSFAQPNSPNYSFSQSLGDATQAFSQEKVAYLVDYSPEEKEIKRLNKDLDFSINPLPQPKTAEKPINFISYENFTVPNTSKNQKLAWALLSSVINSGNAKKYYETSKKHPILTEFINGDDPVGKSILTAQNWYNPEPTKVSQIFRSAIFQVLSGKSAQTALDSAAIEVTNLLETIRE